MHVARLSPAKRDQRWPYSWSNQSTLFLTHSWIREHSSIIRGIIREIIRGIIRGKGISLISWHNLTDIQEELERVQVVKYTRPEEKYEMEAKPNFPVISMDVGQMTSLLTSNGVNENIMRCISPMLNDLFISKHTRKREC